MILRNELINNIVAFGALIGLILLNGCTTELKVNKQVTTINATPTVGWTYNLSFAQYNVVVTRRLVKCENNVVDVKTKVSATQLFEPDPLHTYVIDYRTLSSGWKTSELSVEMHPNGMLKRISAEASDAAPQIVLNTAMGFATIARIRDPSPITTLDKQKQPDICSDNLKNQINDRSKFAGEVRTSTKNLDEAIQALNAISTVAKVVGNKLDADKQAELQDKVSAVSKLRRKLDEKLAKLAKMDAILTEVVNFRWPNKSTEQISSIFKMSDEVLYRWFKDDTSKLLSDKDVAQRINAHSVTLALLPSVENLESVASGRIDGGEIQSCEQILSGLNEKDDFDPTVGIRYRVPVKGKLLYRIGQFEDKCIGWDDGQILVEGSVPQLGRLLTLPYKNAPFQSNFMNATFREDGSLETGGYIDRESIGVNATSTFLDLVDLAAKTADAKVEATNRTEAIQAEIALLRAQDELEGVRLAARRTSSTAEQELQKNLLQADIDFLNAERAKIEAKLALRDARRKASEDASD